MSRFRRCGACWTRSLWPFVKAAASPQSAYHESLSRGMDRSAVVTYHLALAQKWIPALPEVQAALECRSLLRAIRAALKPGGTYPCAEVKAADKLEENAGPLGVYLYSASILSCMTVSLAEGGEGPDAVGLPESKARELCLEAGFSSVRRLPVENPFKHIYEIKP